VEGLSGAKKILIARTSSWPSIADQWADSMVADANVFPIVNITEAALLDKPWFFL
jgi:hypothetical protein